MATIESVEQLRKYANVSYKDAKEALLATNNDVLEAIIYLENQGKVQPPQGGTYTTQKESAPKAKVQKIHVPKETFWNLISRFFDWLSALVRKGNRNMFVIHRDSESTMSMPITLLAILLIIGFWAIVPALIVGLFFGFKYNFRGPDFKSESINNIMDKAANTATSTVEDIKDSVRQSKSEKVDQKENNNEHEDSDYRG